MKRSTTCCTARDRRRPLALRGFAASLCIILFLAPLLACSTSVMALCEEQGCTTPPLVEEEEACHAIPPRHGVIEHRAATDALKAILPTWEAQVLYVQHGEVPHPPPWP